MCAVHAFAVFILVISFALLEYLVTLYLKA